MRLRVCEKCFLTKKRLASLSVMAYILPWRAREAGTLFNPSMQFLHKPILIVFIAFFVLYGQSGTSGSDSAQKKLIPAKRFLPLK